MCLHLIDNSGRALVIRRNVPLVRFANVAEHREARSYVGRVQDAIIDTLFRYERDVDMPSNPYLEDPVPDDIGKWKTFSSNRFGLRLRYPPELDFRVERRNRWEEEGCDSSQAIMLGFQLSAHSTVTQRAMRKTRRGLR
jgi:hypothetical protein